MPNRQRKGREARSRSRSQEHDGNGNGGSPSSRRSSNGQAAGFRIVVIGASAGGVEALMHIARSLPADFPAAVLVVLHIPAQGPSFLPGILDRVGPLHARHPRDGEAIRPGRIYCAPPDFQMLVKGGRILLRRGPRENGARPAIDPLFRTAADSRGPRVIGVILSGGLDDGTLGLSEIKRAGGITVVQDPADALFASMPASAAAHVQVDHLLPLAQIPSVLAELALLPVPQAQGADSMARSRKQHPDISEMGTSNLKADIPGGPPSRFTCPECGGALWELQDGQLLRYRCHVGHGYTADTLMAAQSGRLEEALWVALRALEESAAMRRRMAERARQSSIMSMATRYDHEAKVAEQRAGLVRAVLAADHLPLKLAEQTEARALSARDRSMESAVNTASASSQRKGRRPSTKSRTSNAPGR